PLAESPAANSVTRALLIGAVYENDTVTILVFFGQLDVWVTSPWSNCDVTAPFTGMSVPSEAAMSQPAPSMPAPLTTSSVYIPVAPGSSEAGPLSVTIGGMVAPGLP